MKTELALGMALAVVTLQPAIAQSAGSNSTGLYLGAAAGIHFYDDDDVADFDEGGSLGVQLGYRFNDNIRAELEGELTGADVEGGGGDFLVLGRWTAGLYYDLQSSDSGFVPYFGGGVGVATGEIDDSDEDGEGNLDFDDELTWHAEAGVSLNLNPHVAIVPSYRYTWTDNDEGATEDPITSHAVRVGMRVSF